MFLSIIVAVVLTPVLIRIGNRGGAAINAAGTIQQMLRAYVVTAIVVLALAWAPVAVPALKTGVMLIPAIGFSVTVLLLSVGVSQRVKKMAR